MPTEGEARVAARRTYRLAFGLGISLWFTNAFNWPASFVGAILVATILALPLPAPPLKITLRIFLMVIASLLLGLLVLMPLKTYPLFGLLVIFLGLFLAFYGAGRGALGGLAVMLAIIGFGVVPAIGANAIDAAMAMTIGMGLAMAIVPPFLWIAHAVFPEPPAPAAPAPKPEAEKKPPPPSTVVARFALRPVIVIAPVFLVILGVPNGTDYIAVMIKSATLAAQSNVDSARQAGREMVASTVIGGVIAILIWGMTRIWPTLTWYVLLHVVAALYVGKKIFSGRALTPKASMWSYALVTALIINGPAVFGSGFTGEPSGMRTWARIAQFLFVSLYASGAVFLFDHLFQRSQRKKQSTPA